MRFLVVMLAALPFSGCLNDCQKLCNEMAAYWEDCDLPFGDAEAADCRKHFRKSNEDPSGVSYLEKYEASCRQLSRPAGTVAGRQVSGLRSTYSCEEMAAGPGIAVGR
jgi:hypothetical protein